jgi:hypothetical protein
LGLEKLLASSSKEGVDENEIAAKALAAAVYGTFFPLRGGT